MAARLLTFDRLLRCCRVHGGGLAGPHRMKKVRAMWCAPRRPRFTCTGDLLALGWYVMVNYVGVCVR
jgi:hypothetical protein